MTFVLSEDMHREAKIMAVNKGITMRVLFLTALEQYILQNTYNDKETSS